MTPDWTKFNGSLPEDVDFGKLEWCWRIKPTPPCPRDLWIRPSLDGKTADLLPYDKEHEAEAHWLLYKHVREVVE